MLTHLPSESRLSIATDARSPRPGSGIGYPAPGAPCRVLAVGFSERNKYFGSFFHATHQKLRNGFIRSGCSVTWFSDRDWAEYLAPLAIRAIGRPFANRRLLQLADTIEPDVVILMHADLVSAQTLQTLRRRHPRTRIATVHLDLVSPGAQTERFRRLAGESDATFVTTSVEGLGRAADGMTVGFIPNPVDPSYENVLSYLEPQHPLDFVFAGKAKGREVFLDELQSRLPHRRCGWFLQDRRALPLGGANYVRTLAASRIGLNPGLSQQPRWYSSDRIAQLLAAGCAVAQPRVSGLQDLYGHDALLTFDGAADLAEKSDSLLNSGRWRDIALRGRERALEISNATLVASYILDRIAGTRTFDWPEWSANYQP